MTQTIEVEVDIEDYLDVISTESLLKELKERGREVDPLDAIAETLDLNIVQTDILKTFLKALK